MDRLEWYRCTLLAAADRVAQRCSPRSAARAHLGTMVEGLRAGGHLDRDTRRKLKQWIRRYQPKDADDRLGHLVRTVLAAADLLQSLEAQGTSPTTPVLCNVARLAHYVGVEDPVVEAMVPGRSSFGQAMAQASVSI